MIKQIKWEKLRDKQPRATDKGKPGDLREKKILCK